MFFHSFYFGTNITILEILRGEITNIGGSLMPEEPRAQKRFIAKTLRRKGMKLKARMGMIINQDLTGFGNLLGLYVDVGTEYPNPEGMTLL